MRKNHLERGEFVPWRPEFCFYRIRKVDRPLGNRTLLFKMNFAPLAPALLVIKFDTLSEMPYPNSIFSGQLCLYILMFLLGR